DGHRSQPAGPAYSDHPGERAEGLAEGRGLREASAGGNRDVPLQDPDWSHAARPHYQNPEDRSPDRLFGDQPDDATRDAGLGTHPIKKPARAPVYPRFGFMHQRRSSE